MEHNQFDNNHIRLDPIAEPGYSESIERRSLKPMNDPNCTHDWRDDPEVIGAMRAQTCRNCPIGRWVKNEVS